jgi:hypothetical protein
MSPKSQITVMTIMKAGERHPETSGSLKILKTMVNLKCRSKSSLRLPCTWSCGTAWDRDEEARSTVLQMGPNSTESDGIQLWPPKQVREHRKAKSDSGSKVMSDISRIDCTCPVSCSPRPGRMEFFLSWFENRKRKPASLVEVQRRVTTL